MSFDLSNINVDWLNTVDWLYVAVLGIFAFLAALVAHFISLGNRGVGAVLTAILFAAFYVGWTYYPHGLPLPVAPGGTKAAAAPVAAPAATPPPPAAPQRPRNPVTDITPGR